VDFFLFAEVGGGGGGGGVHETYVVCVLILIQVLVKGTMPLQ